MKKANRRTSEAKKTVDQRVKSLQPRRLHRTGLAEHAHPPAGGPPLAKRYRNRRKRFSLGVNLMAVTLNHEVTTYFTQEVC